MPGEVDETVESILEDNPDMDEEEAWAIAYDQYEGDTEKRAQVAKSASNGRISKMSFSLNSVGSVSTIFKADDDFVIWGPASVEVVDKENDRITAEALRKALPQLLKRRRLSYEHSDQIVGDILERFETEEPVDVEINGETYERSEFPTDVLELDGQKPGLYVAGNVYNDTQKAQEVRKSIENGEINSYSISGEAVVSEMAVKDGRTFTDILKLDLSAVTLCKEGMNQYAEFDIVSKEDEQSPSPLGAGQAASIAKSRIESHMGSEDQDDESVQKFVDALDKTLDERLPDGEIATKSDVEEMVEEQVKAYSGDNPNETDTVMEEPTDDPDATTDEQSTEPVDGPADDRHKAESYTSEELKSILPDDQYKAIAPLLERAEGGLPEEEEEVVEPEEEMPEEEILPEDDEEQEIMRRMKAIDNLEWNRLSKEQKEALLKGGADLEKAESNVSTSPGVSGDADPAHAGDGSVQAGDRVIKADSSSVAADPAMRRIYDEDGNPQI